MTVISQESEEPNSGGKGEDNPNPNPSVPSADNQPKNTTLEGEINTKKIVEEKRKINVLGSEEIQKRAQARTEQEIKFPPHEEKKETTTQNIDEYRKKINEEAINASKGMTVEKYKSLAGSLVMVMDFVLGAVLRRWALDTKDSGYGIEKDKKDELQEQLANILIVTNTMFPIVGVFIITLLACYITPVMNAYNHRQEVNRIREEKKKKGEPETEIDPKTNLPKKKIGRPAKG